MGYMETYKAWCENEYFDEDTRAELKSIAGDEKEIEDRFYKDLEFGTGGLRGVIGNGTNRMNVYIVRKATQGLANFIIKEGTQDKGVAISHDNRRMSREFAQEAALCLAAKGIHIPFIKTNTRTFICSKRTSLYSRYYGYGKPQSSRIQWI